MTGFNDYHGTYGQKIDVTVVDMLNLRNQAEKRIYELLGQKFHVAGITLACVLSANESAGS